jgi:hypothetical protein
MEKRKFYSLKAKKEALKAMSGGMSNKDIAVVTGINIHTLTLWKTELKNGKITLDGISATEPKEYACEICGETFNKPILFAQHKATNHRKNLNKTLKMVLSNNHIPKDNNSSSSRMSLDEFVQLLRDLTTDYIKVKEELALERKSKEEWRLRAGHFLEQAQQSINR